MCPPRLGSCSSTAGLHPGGCSRWGGGWRSAPARWQPPPALVGPPIAPRSLLRASLLSLSSADRRLGDREQQPPRLCFRVHSLPLLCPVNRGDNWPQTPKGLLSAGRAFVCQGWPTGRAPECAEPGRPWKESCALTLHPAPGCPVRLSSRQGGPPSPPPSQAWASGPTAPCQPQASASPHPGRVLAEQGVSRR